LTTQLKVTIFLGRGKDGKEKVIAINPAIPSASQLQAARGIEACYPEAGYCICLGNYETLQCNDSFVPGRRVLFTRGVLILIWFDAAASSFHK